jgi:hypothetical protein
VGDHSGVPRLPPRFFGAGPWVKAAINLLTRKRENKGRAAHDWRLRPADLDSLTHIEDINPVNPFYAPTKLYRVVRSDPDLALRYFMHDWCPTAPAGGEYCMHTHIRAYILITHWPVGDADQGANLLESARRWRCTAGFLFANKSGFLIRKSCVVYCRWT